MREFFIGFIIALILISIFYCDDIETLISHKKECAGDGRCYTIVGKFDPDTHDEAGEMLAYLNDFSIKLMRSLRKNYLWHGDNLYRKELVAFLLHNYNPDALIENAPTSSVNTSYVENKGRVFAVCLREKLSGLHNIHDKQILEFVTMHEMAHLSTPKIGHKDPEFWINFKILIDEARRIGIHEPVDYSKHPINYCSLRVNYNPYFDSGVPLK